MTYLAYRHQYLYCSVGSHTAPGLVHRVRFPPCTTWRLSITGRVLYPGCLLLGRNEVAGESFVLYEMRRHVCTDIR